MSTLKEIIYSTTLNKCPRCHEGKVFENDNPYSFKNGLQMNKNCSSCGLKYEKETGFFYGAMYVSYALQVGLFICLYTLDTFFWHLKALVLVSIVIGAILLLMPVTFRWSRILWMNFFTPYQKSKSVENTTV